MRNPRRLRAFNFGASEGGDVSLMGYGRSRVVDASRWLPYRPRVMFFKSVCVMNPRMRSVQSWGTVVVIRWRRDAIRKLKCPWLMEFGGLNPRVVASATIRGARSTLGSRCLSGAAECVCVDEPTVSRWSFDQRKISSVCICEIGCVFCYAHASRGNRDTSRVMYFRRILESAGGGSRRGRISYSGGVVVRRCLCGSGDLGPPERSCYRRSASPDVLRDCVCDPRCPVQVRPPAMYTPA